MTDNEHRQLIYVYLLDEPVDAWRPVQAVGKGNGRYLIVPENPVPADETWEFAPGDIVRVQERRFGEHRTELVAVERVDSSFWEA
jgi:hypothetical protein